MTFFSSCFLMGPWQLSHSLINKLSFEHSSYLSLILKVCINCFTLWLYWFLESDNLNILILIGHYFNPLFPNLNICDRFWTTNPIKTGKEFTKSKSFLSFLWILQFQIFHKNVTLGTIGLRLDNVQIASILERQ